MKSLKKKEKEKVEQELLPVVLEEENEYVSIKPVMQEGLKKEIERKEIKVPKLKEKKEEKRKKAYEKIKETFKEAPLDFIETSIDELLDMVEEKGSVSILDASKKLKVDVEQVENWAKILEEHGLLEIVYPLIGFPTLRKKEWKKEL